MGYFKDKTSWDRVWFPIGSSIGSTVYYRGETVYHTIGEKPSVLMYTYITAMWVHQIYDLQTPHGGIITLNPTYAKILFILRL